MKTLVTGAAGQLGAEICRLLGPAAIATDLATLDLTHGPAAVKALLEMKPGAVINCAAYTAVDQAESDAGLCRAINVMAVEHLAEACRRLNCPLVQISTDYVFGGRRSPDRPWREEDEPLAEGVYAETKLAGERAAAGYEKHLIVRTCGLYARPSHTGARNFVQTILRLARTRPKLRIVHDQRCTPSYVPDVARAVLFLLGIAGGDSVGDSIVGGDSDGNLRRQSRLPQLRPAPWGIYHVTNRGATNWYEFACEIVRLAGLEVALEPITTAEYGSAAPRPAYSVLDTTAYHRLGGPAMPEWREALAAYFEEMTLHSPPRSP